MRRLVLTTTLIAAVALPAAPAGAAVTATRSAKKVARAMVAKPSLLLRSRFLQLPPQGNPVATANTRLRGFRPHRRTFGVLSTGDATLLDDPNEQDDLSTDNGGQPFRGGAIDTVVLRLDLRAPRRANCLSFKLRFFSEEYDEFVDTEFNDAFIAEVGRSLWRSDPADARLQRLRNNFARDRRFRPISVNGTGAFAVNGPRSAGTTYDGATSTLTARKRVRPGRRVKLFLSILDQGDNEYDSTVIVDRLNIRRRARCRTGR
jgi:hypothetical protein